MKRIFKAIMAFIGAMLMAWLGNYFYDSTKNIPVLSPILRGLKWLYNAGITVLNYPVKVWVIIVATSAIYLLYKLYKAAKKDTALPDFINYRKDKFRLWIWHWDWRQTPEGWEIINLRPHCPNDDVQLLNEGTLFQPHYRCPKCNTRFLYGINSIESENETRILIHHNVDNDNCPKA